MSDPDDVKIEKARFERQVAIDRLSRVPFLEAPDIVCLCRDVVDAQENLLAVCREIVFGK